MNKSTQTECNNDFNSLLKIANELEKSNSNKDLRRLYQLAGFVIRRLDNWDIYTYMREYERQLKPHRAAVINLHEILYCHLTDYQKGLFGYKTNKEYKYIFGPGMEGIYYYIQTYFGSRCPVYNKYIKLNKN